MLGVDGMGTAGALLLRVFSVPRGAAIRLAFICLGCPGLSFSWLAGVWLTCVLCGPVQRPGGVAVGFKAHRGVLGTAGGAVFALLLCRGLETLGGLRPRGRINRAP
jgi:hypothetical protein